MKLVRHKNQAGGVKCSQLKREVDHALNNHKIVLPDDTTGHEELCTVDDQSGEVTEEKHDDNANKDTGKIHLIVSRTVTVGSHMGVPLHDEFHIRRKYFDTPYFIPLNILVLKYTSKTTGKIPVSSNLVQFM